VSFYQYGMQAVLVVWLCSLASFAPAADYAFSFSPGDARFNLEHGNNRGTFEAMISLLRDFHGAGGFNFILTGNDADHCQSSSLCNAAALLEKRVNAITSEIGSRKADENLALDLKWQAAETARDAMAEDLVRLQVSNHDPRSLSPHCPFILEVIDPRLPSSAGHQDWVNMSGVAQIYLTAGASIRIRSADPATAADVSVRQVLGKQTRDLAPKGQSAQWQASELLSDSGSADLQVSTISADIAATPAVSSLAARKRDVSEASEPLPGPGPGPVAGQPEGCEIRLLLRK
jgi:hypothetical protein